MKSIITFFVCILFATNINAQTRYIIKFKDKATNPFSIANPSAYLGPRALQRRVRYNIAIDSLDLPVTPRYVDSVRLAGVVTILNTSKWLNQVTIKTTDAVALAKINSFPFVVSSEAVASKIGDLSVPVNKMFDDVIDVPIPADNASNSFTEGTSENTYSYGRANGQVRIHQGEFLHNHGFRGEGMQITVLDAGFFHYLSLPTFDSIRTNNQIINIWDFVANQASVDEDHTHGMNCLSSIAANMPGVFVGTAPKANFCLFRTEDVVSETIIEEHNLSAGYERADSIGVDVCSISLGYNTFDFASQNHTYNDLNGHKTMAAIASNIAARKGMLAVIACGNGGNTPAPNVNHYVSTPGDADSAMTVGAVDTISVVAGFSSYGPNSSGAIKPNIASVGRAAVIASPSTGLPVFGNGTSFATPNIAGLTTCLWQAFPEFNNMTILDAMQRSATKYATPDDRVGYGIPDMKKSFAILLRKSYTQQSSITNCIATMNVNVKYDNTMNVVVERKQSTQSAYSTFKTINGIGAFTNKNISFTDDLSTVSAGTVNYRIKINIAADTSFYLDSIAVNAPTLCTTPINEVKINPNVVTDKTDIIISRANATKIGIVLTNAVGQAVYKNEYNQPAGAQVKSINMQNMPVGIYFVTVFADDKKIETVKILKR
jgi:serine protease AprX